MIKVTVDIDYEGSYSEYFNDLTVAKKWIKDSKYNLCDVTVEIILETIEVFKLMEDV